MRTKRSRKKNDVENINILPRLKSTEYTDIHTHTSEATGH